MDDGTLVNRVVVTYLGGNRVRMVAGHRSFEADRRTQVGRPGASFCPLELVAAALGAWMVLTMAAVAENKGISVTTLAASVVGHTEFVNLRANTRFVSQLDLGEGLTPRERRILLNSARQCEVHKMLQGEVVFEEHSEALDDPSLPQ